MIDIHIDEDNFDVRHLQHKRVLYAGSMEHHLSNTFRNKDSDSETDEVLRANQQRNIADGMALFPKLQRGLDVNVGFTRVDAFEYSEDQVIFDLLSVRLVHGWLEPLVETQLGISQVPPGGSGRSLDPSTATAAAQGGAL